MKNDFIQTLHCSLWSLLPSGLLVDTCLHLFDVLFAPLCSRRRSNVNDLRRKVTHENSRAPQMPLPGRLFANDAELGKKDDDHRPSRSLNSPLPSLSWAAKKPLPRVRRRRIVALTILLIGLYFFFKNMPTDLLPVSQRYDRRTPGQLVSGLHYEVQQSLGSTVDDEPVETPPEGPPPKLDTKDEAKVNHNYDGFVKFIPLMPSLQAYSRKMGYSSYNRNVLFLAANLKSASRVIPFACEMSRWNRNIVHFAYMGRDDVTMMELQRINGAGKECEVHWHGTRIEHVHLSTSTYSIGQMLDQYTRLGVPTIEWKRLSPWPWDIYKSSSTLNFTSAITGLKKKFHSSEPFEPKLQKRRRHSLSSR